MGILPRRKRRGLATRARRGMFDVRWFRTSFLIQGLPKSGSSPDPPKPAPCGLFYGNSRALRVRTPLCYRYGTGAARHVAGSVQTQDDFVFENGTGLGGNLAMSTEAHFFIRVGGFDALAESDQ